MDLQVVHGLVRSGLGKDRSAYFDPEEIDTALDRAQLDEFIYLVGDAAGYQLGRPVPMAAYGMNRKIHQDLMPFKETVDVLSTDYNDISNVNGSGPDGVIVLPSNFEYLTSLRGGLNERFSIISEDELAQKLNSDICPPTTTYPAAILAGAGGVVNDIDIGTKKKIQLFPEAGRKATYTYLRRPAAPSISQSLAGRVLTYDAGASTQLEWGDQAVVRIVRRAVAYLAKDIDRRDIANDELSKL